LGLSPSYLLEKAYNQIMYNSFELFFFWRKCSAVVVGVQTSFLPFAKRVTEKKQRRVDCAEAGKKTVQTQRNDG